MRTSSPGSPRFRCCWPSCGRCTPKLFERPLVKSLPHALERGSILMLSGAAFFELVTGIFNIAQNYVFSFYFPDAHYAVAWIAVGSILLHIAVKLPIIRRALQRDPLPDPARRAFLRTTWLAAGVATAGATVPLLRNVSALAWRSGNGPQGLPVNRTAAGQSSGTPQAHENPRWGHRRIQGRTGQPGTPDRRINRLGDPELSLWGSKTLCRGLDLQ